jgi:hypothetical protein
MREEPRAIVGADGPDVDGAAVAQDHVGAVLA